MDLDFLKNACLQFELVGSRITCDPAPTDTDQDVLVLTTPALWNARLAPALSNLVFQKGGSDCGDAAGYLGAVPMSFQSFVRDDLNLIVTFDRDFYRRFLAATSLCKWLNLLEKPHRIRVFQTVLYGNGGALLPALALPDAAIPTPNVECSVGPFWVVGSERGQHGCVEATDADAARTLAAGIFGAPPIACDKIPYPAEPRLHTVPHAAWGATPSFCYSPHTCKGRSSCPQRYSCTE